MSVNKRSSSFMVYSTDPNFKVSEDEEEANTLLPKDQKLKVQLDKKHRAGKAVTLISGFIGKEMDLEELGKKLKTTCGCGGSVKNGEVIVQGDNRDKIMIWLKNNGFLSAKKI